jgi:recombination protein RecA
MAKVKNMSKTEMLSDLKGMLQKQFGKENIGLLSDVDMDVVTIPTGSLKIDDVLGGGIAEGRIVEIYGAESSGKTTLALQIMASVQAKNEIGAFIDLEHAFDPVYAENLGVDTDNLMFSQPTDAETTLDLVEALASSGLVKLIVLDSVAALVPKAELEGDADTITIGLLARLLSKTMKKLVSVASNNKCTVIFINQTRDNIGVMGYGDKKTTTGGNALKFYASQRIESKRIGGIKKGDQDIGNKVTITVKKNKIAPPFRKAQVEIYFGEGISKYAEMIDYAINFDIIDKAGAWFSYNDAKIGQGMEKVMNTLKDDSALYKEITDKVLAKIAEQKQAVKDEIAAKKEARAKQQDTAEA